MKLTKIEPKYVKKHNPRVGLITLASDFRIEKDFNNLIYGKDIDLYCNRIHCYNPLTNETLKKKTGKIVLSSNQTLIWDTLKKINCNNKVEGFGELFNWIRCMVFLLCSMCSCTCQC